MPARAFPRGRVAQSSFSDRGTVMRRQHRQHRASRASSVSTVSGIEPLEGRLLMAIIAVLNTSDTGAGSLRAAVNAAVDGDVIQLDAAANGEVSLASELFINKDLTIHGLGTAVTTLSGGGQGRVFNIAAGADVHIDSLTVMNGGNVADGGGIANAGSLTLALVDVTGNQATNRGGGIYNTGVLTMTACSVAGNAVIAPLSSGAAGGGGLASGVDAGAVSITDSTFADNAVAF